MLLSTKIQFPLGFTYLFEVSDYEELTVKTMSEGSKLTCSSLRFNRGDTAKVFKALKNARDSRKDCYAGNFIFDIVDSTDIKEHKGGCSLVFNFVDNGWCLVYVMRNINFDPDSKGIEKRTVSTLCIDPATASYVIDKFFGDGEVVKEGCESPYSRNYKPAE